MNKPSTLGSFGRLIPLIACIGLLWCCLTLLKDPGIYLGLMLIGIVVPLKYFRIASTTVALLLAFWIIFLMTGMSVLIVHTWPEEKSSHFTDKHFCSENIHLLGKMIVSYEQENGQLPPLVSKDGQGNPLHGWRIHMLPRLSQAGIYKQLDLEKPWDAPKNLAVFEKFSAIEMYRCPKRKRTTDPMLTHYAAYHGPGSAWNPSTDADPDDQILLIETDQPIRWFEPQDLSSADLPEGVTDPRHLSSSPHYSSESLFYNQINEGGHIVYRSGRIEFFSNPTRIEPNWINLGLAAGIFLSFSLALLWPIRKSNKENVRPDDQKEDSSPNKTNQ